jgi:hypothetical protein
VNVHGAAVIDVSGTYRYALYRWWGDPTLTRKWERVGVEEPPILVPAPDLVPRVLWVMLNPSTADAAQDDPTIRRCLRFTARWGYAQLAIVNLFAFRATDPRALERQGWPVGPENDWWIGREAGRASRIIAAWGARGAATRRVLDVERVLRQEAATDRLECLGRTPLEHIRHPLYVQGDTRPELYLRLPRWSAAG